MPFALVVALALGQATAYPVDEADLVSPAETRARRETLMRAMPPDSVAVLFTNPEHQRSNDTDFRFRPNSDFWYLTGCEEPESAVILAPGGFALDGKRVREALFVLPRDPARETWTGRRMGAEVAAKRLGFETALPNARFEDALKAIGGLARCRVRGIEGATGRLAEMIAHASVGYAPKNDDPNLTRTIGLQRTVKSPWELACERRAIAASMLAHREAMRSAEPGMREWEVQSLVEYLFARNGCEAVAYGSIVGSGENSCTLHYETDRKTMKSGEMVVMDVGGEYHGYAADITRSFPVSGRFSAEQKAVYEIVLKAQLAGIAECKPGAPFNSADKAARQIVGAGLVALGIVKAPAESRRYFMHGTSHYVGLDVHDPQGQGNLLPNSILTVEPGIYIPAGSPCDPKWWNIGVRIEDDVLVTAGAPEVLSGALVKDVPGIEALMRERGLGNRPELSLPKG